MIKKTPPSLKEAIGPVRKDEGVFAFILQNQTYGFQVNINN